MKKIFLTVLIILGTLNCSSQSKKTNEEKFRLAINEEFDSNFRNCSSGIDAVSNYKGKKEFWNICELENDNRIITIESHEDDTYFQEIYFEKNGNLIYAKETENYIPKNHFTQKIWNCEFYIKNLELVSLISLGHGKTEDDKWDPDVIFEMYKNRLTELKQIKK
ncbi:hypothetical protein [Tenacibaculum sp. 190524A05c]|uniref:Lipoprotein n=1 Tax=Tenacibaculum platacis TaxID=3137852 RepID=A0ABM9P2E5_9FLAO